MDLGISSYTYSWAIGVKGNTPKKPMTVFGLLEQAIRYGVHRVQIADNLPLHSHTWKELEAIRDFASENAIGIEVGMRGMAPKDLMEYLGLAVFFDSPFLRVVIDKEGFEPGVDEIVDIINAALPKFKDAKVILALENHDRFKAKSFVEIIEQTDKEWVGICLDTVNSLGADQAIVEVLRELAPFTVNFHIKDYEIKRKPHNLGFDVTGTPAGQGMMPLDLIINELAKYNRCQSAILELWTPPANDLQGTITKEDQWAEASIAYLKKMVKNEKV